MAGPSSGSSTVRSACDGVAPRSWAASSRSRPIDSRRPRTITTTYDTENVTWPSSIAGRPSGIDRVQVVEDEEQHRCPSRSRASPAGSASAGSTPARSRPRQRASPSASATPSGVAISIVSTASSRLFDQRLAQRSGRASSERVGSPHHQRNEKPCHVLRDRPELNENWIAISTGTSDHDDVHPGDRRQDDGPAPRVRPPGAEPRLTASAQLPRRPVGRTQVVRHHHHQQHRQDHDTSDAPAFFCEPSNR